MLTGKHKETEDDICLSQTTLDVRNLSMLLSESVQCGVIAV